MAVIRANDLTVQTNFSAGGYRIAAALDELARVTGRTVVITSGSERTGRVATDPHARGEAIDVRTRDWTADEIVRAYFFLQLTLGPRFTVLYEAPALADVTLALAAIATINPRATGPHFHIQVTKGAVYP